MLIVAVVMFSGCATTPATGRPDLEPAAAAPATTAPQPGPLLQPAAPPVGEVVSVLYARGAAISKTDSVYVDLGTPVTLRVLSDVADEVHLHGYERRTTAVPGHTVELTFTADTPGVFTAELHEANAELVEFTVL